MKNVCLLLFLLLAKGLFAQDSCMIVNKTLNVPDKLLLAMDKRTVDCKRKLDQTSKRYLMKMMNLEQRMQCSLAGKDTVTSHRLFGNTDSLYNSLIVRISIPVTHDGAIKTVTLECTNGNILPGDVKNNTR